MRVMKFIKEKTKVIVYLKGKLQENKCEKLYGWLNLMKFDGILIKK